MKAKVFKSFLVGCMMLVASACAHLTVDQRIHATNQGVTIVLTQTDSALRAHVITLAQAESVSGIAHKVVPVLDAAKAASDAGDAAGASRSLKLATALLAALDSYIPPVKE